MSESKIKKAVIREDLLSITKDYRKAILLNQFIYWSERVSDADKFIEKENEIAKNNGEVERELFYGWIYKTAEELADEVMLGLSASQIRRYINDLVELGYLSKRNNPKYKWDRTLQYRVNLVNIAKDLKKNGFPLSDYKIDISDDENTITHPCVINDEPEENQSQSGERAIPENTNKDYDNRDYHTETTDKYALEDMKRLSSKGDMYASVPEEHKDASPKKQSRYIPPDYTEEQLIEHIRPTIEENLKTIQEDCGMEYNPKRADDIIEIVTDFFEQYREKTGHRHKILPDATLINIMYQYFNPPECLWDSNDPTTYSAMIEKYLDANFNARGGYDGEITLSISHFMSDKIRENCYHRSK